MGNVDFRSMTKEEALIYCWEHEEEYIRDIGSGGREEFDCMIALLEDGNIKPSELPSFGMDY